VGKLMAIPRPPSWTWLPLLGGEGKGKTRKRRRKKKKEATGDAGAALGGKVQGFGPPSLDQGHLW